MALSVNRVRWVILFLLFFSLVNGQENTINNVDSIWWEETTKELNYEEDKAEYKPIDRSGESPDISWLFSPILTYSVLFIAVLILLIILYRLYLKNMLDSTNERKEREYRYFEKEDLDDHFYEMDLNSILKDSLEMNDWKMAIRIRYLLLLKALIDANKIAWHSDLTNLQISRQLSTVQIQGSFRTLVNIVELFWYGDAKSSESDYHDFTKQCKDFSIEVKGGAE